MPWVEAHLSGQQIRGYLLEHAEDIEMLGLRQLPLTPAGDATRSGRGSADQSIGVWRIVRGMSEGRASVRILVVETAVGRPAMAGRTLPSMKANPRKATALEAMRATTRAMSRSMSGRYRVADQARNTP